MVRERSRNAVLALLGIVAVALTATTLPTARQPQRRDSGGSGSPGHGDGAGISTQSGEPLAQLLEVPFLSELLVALAVVLAAAALWVLYDHWRTAFRVTVVVLLLSVVLAVVLQFASFESFVEPVSNSSATGLNGSGGEGGDSAESAPGPSLVSLVLVGVVALVVLVAAVTATLGSATDDDPEPDADDGATSPAAAVGRAAGRAADRIESTAELDNEVYQAWREMTAFLDVHRPETTTPREFEHAATEAGMESADVADLTALFERVRYDDYEVSPADEQRAVELLRRIESRYTAADDTDERAMGDHS